MTETGGDEHEGWTNAFLLLCPPTGDGHGRTLLRLAQSEANDEANEKAAPRKDEETSAAHKLAL
jgi:hypothetical protein